MNIAPKPGTTLDMAAAKTALEAIKAANSAAALDTAVNAARAFLELNFAVHLGDGVDITGEGLADQGAGAALI